MRRPLITFFSVFIFNCCWDSSIFPCELPVRVTAREKCINTEQNES